MQSTTILCHAHKCIDLFYICGNICDKCIFIYILKDNTYVDMLYPSAMNIGLCIASNKGNPLSVLLYLI